jgi:hypothetical protein
VRIAPGSHKTERGRGWLRPLALFFYFCTAAAAAFRNALNFSGSSPMERNLSTTPGISAESMSV